MQWNYKSGETENCKRFNLFTGHEIDKHSFYDKSNVWDLEVFAYEETNNNQWLLTLRTNGKDAGIQISEKQMFMAPEHGYAQEISFNFKKQANTSGLKFLAFVRTASPTTFLRIDFTYSTLNDILLVESEVFMNPYGERLLESVMPFRDWQDEYTQDLKLIQKHQKKASIGMEVYLPIMDAAEKAIHNRKLADKPDISSHLKEGILIFTDRRHY